MTILPLQHGPYLKAKCKYAAETLRRREHCYKSCVIKVMHLSEQSRAVIGQRKKTS